MFVCRVGCCLWVLMGDGCMHVLSVCVCVCVCVRTKACASTNILSYQFSVHTLFQTHTVWPIIACFYIALYIWQLHLVTAVWGCVWGCRLCGPLNVSSAAAWVSSGVTQGVCVQHIPLILLSEAALPVFPIPGPNIQEDCVHSQLFVAFPFVSHHLTESLTHLFSALSRQQKQSSTFHPFISTPLLALLPAAPCPLTSAPRAGQMAAICSNIWGYKLASLCVCRLFTNGPSDGPTHCTRCVWISRQEDGNWMDDRLTAANRWPKLLRPPCLPQWHIWDSGGCDARLVQ